MVIDSRPWSLVVDHGHWWSTAVFHGQLTLYFTFFLTEQMVSTNLSMYYAIIHLYSLIMTLFHTQTI